MALTGRNPFRVEMDELREEVVKTTLKVKTLQDVYQKSLKNWEEEQNLLFESGKMVAERDKQIASLQRLVENLRQRIIQKDDE